VSVDPPATSRRVKERLKSRVTFLADQEGALLDALGIRHQGGRNDGVDIAYPTAMLVDANGVVRWIFQSGSIAELRD
jgi:peroxiredoxin